MRAAHLVRVFNKRNGQQTLRSTCCQLVLAFANGHRRSDSNLDQGSIDKDQELKGTQYRIYVNLVFDIHMNYKYLWLIFTDVCSSLRCNGLVLILCVVRVFTVSDVLICGTLLSCHSVESRRSYAARPLKDSCSRRHKPLPLFLHQ